jgi:hypothetical protein
MMDVARNDVAFSRHLRECLALLRDRTSDEAFRRMSAEVLDGRRSLREAFASPTFQGVVEPLANRFAAQYEEMDDEEREQLARDGQRQMDRRRQ